MGGPGKLVNAASVWILRNVTRRRVWANIAATGRGTKPYCGWSLGVMSLALMCVKRAMWIPRIVSVWAVSVTASESDIVT